MEACLPCDKTGMTCQYWPHSGNISCSINDIIPSKRQHNAVLTEWLRHYVVIIHLGIMLCKYDVTWASCRLNSWSNRSFIQKLVHVINKNLFMLSAKFALMVICVWNSTVKILHNNDVIIDGVSNHQPRDCLLKRLFRRRSKKTSKLRVTGLCVGNSPGTGEFTAQMASNAENFSIWWRHHVPSQRPVYVSMPWRPHGFAYFHPSLALGYV